MKDTPHIPDRLDRPDPNRIIRAAQTPWTTTDQRGALNLDQDSSEHRRYHSLFEDLLN
ncbi:MAG: hypothetical protein AAGF30_15765 [Pseudomonadota bacterium]